MPLECPLSFFGGLSFGWLNNAKRLRHGIDSSLKNVSNHNDLYIQIIQITQIYTIYSQKVVTSQDLRNI